MSSRGTLSLFADPRQQRRTALVSLVVNTRPIVTPAGRRRLEARLNQALQAYHQVTSSNAEAAESGDTSVWHDNFAYEENQRLMHQLGRRVHDLRALLEQAAVIERPSLRCVTVGTRVRVVDTETTVERALVVGGFDDGDPNIQRVSYTAPLAAALLGAEPGETRTVVLGVHTREFEVVDVGLADEEFA